MLVKDNHPLLHTKLAAFFNSPGLFEAEFERVSTSELGHGRIETRCLICSADVPADYTGFAGVQQVFRLERECVHKRSGHKRQEEVVYGISSLPPQQGGARKLLGYTREHWHIENKSHWVRDVTYDEDRSQVRCGSIPQALAAVRNACIGLMRVAGHTCIPTAHRRHAARPEEALALIGISEN
jgi:predicted transposase YbfD/YdcC